MFKIFKKPLLMFIFIFCLFIGNTTAFGAEPIYVKINNIDVNYTDALPQIMNQRAMVPIRATAELLGAEINWNKDTETMTLHKGDRTVVHTMRSKVITVNGKATTFDTPSAVVSNRMMMPVRMLSTSLGNEVAWDNATRTVNITAAKASIISATPDKTSIKSGQTINITIVASNNTEKIKILDVNENGKMVAEANTYIENANGTKTFSIPYTPNVYKSSFKTLKVLAGNSLSYNEQPTSYKAFAVSISADLSPSIITFDVDKTNVGRGDEIKITITANSKTDFIKISTKNNDKLLQISNYQVEDINNPNTRIFEATLKMEERGNIELMAYAGLNGQVSSEYKSVNVLVEGSGSITDTKNTTLNIKDAYVLNDGLYVDENAQIIVKTSPDITRIEILDDKNNILTNTRYASIKNDNMYVWDLGIKIPKEGRNRLNIIAYNSDDKKTTYNFNASAYSYSKNDLHILNIVQSDIGATSGDNIKFSITTTPIVDNIKIFDGSKEIITETRSSDSSSIKEWTVRINVDNYNKDSLRVIAIDSSGREDSKKINVYLAPNSTGKIYEYDIITPEVYLNDTIKLNLYTNTSIEKVWVEDEDGTSMVRKTTESGKSGDEYTWKLSFPAEKTGNNVRYTIFAKDENSKVYEDIFRVRVKK